MRAFSKLSIGLGATAAAGLAYAAGFEVRSFRVRRVEIPVLPAGQRALRVLHVSDAHVQPGQRRKLDWLRSLDALEPDFVINTGDNLAHVDAVPVVLDAMAPLLDRPGAFVLGSNDYFAPVMMNPAGYLFRGSDRALDNAPLPWEDLRDGFAEAGWIDLSNARNRIKADHREIELVGTDDPHINRDRYHVVAGPADHNADVNIGVVHAPYRRVLDGMAGDGFGLILAGHTHGGQLRVPGYGALVTNCDLPPRQARGLSRYGNSLLHVSAGAGTSPYAPVRFACPPEASLLTLVARD